MKTLFVKLVVLFLCVSPQLAEASERVALVIGNGDYLEVAPLSNPRNDAEDIAASLSRLGFEVTRAFDLDARAMNIALRNFSRRSSQADMAVVYYAGHGMEIQNVNYLLPVDAVLERASDVAFEATDMNKFLRSVWGAKQLRLVLLDACRDNPFLKRFPDLGSRSTRRGLGVIEPTAGVIVGYSARGGTVALDGDGRNSPYAAALLEHLEEPGLEIGQLFRRVRDTVLTNTRGQQEPFTYGSLPSSEIYLRDPEPTGPRPSEVLEDFLNADEENSPSGWKAFLEVYSGLDVSPSLIARAESKLALLNSRTQTLRVPAPNRPVARNPDDDPMIRACDQLAGNPDDPNLPSGINGVAEEAININAAVTACTLASAGYPKHARSHYQLARAQKVAGELSKSGLTMLRAAELGYSQAGISLGSELLLSGNAADRETGFGLLSAAMKNGSATAPKIIGDFLASPASISSRKFGSPLKYYQISADRGNIEAMYQAGHRLVSGSLSNDSEVRQGLKYLESAAQGGHMAASRRLANFHLFYVRSNRFSEPEIGIQWLKRSAEGGSSKSAKQLATLYRTGQIVDRNLSEAIHWIEVAALQGDSFAMVENAFNWEIGKGRPKSPVKAAEFYVEALQKGSVLPYRRLTSEWDPATAMEVQKLLEKQPKARYRGGIDGVVGPGTRSAMARLCACKAGPARVSFRDSYGE